MEFLIRGQALNPELNRTIRQYLQSALSRHQAVIERVTLDWREDAEETEQESYLYRCELRLRFRGGGEVLISTVSEDLLEAMRLSAEQASRLASRRQSATP